MNLKRYAGLRWRPLSMVVVGLAPPLVVATWQHLELVETVPSTLLALAAAAVAGLSAAWLGNEMLVTRPLRSLAHVTDRLRAGDFEARSGVSHISGEVGELGRGLDELAEALQRRDLEREQTQKALLESTRRLEQTLVELRSAQDMVIQQERLGALGQMASGIAHDFNNALAIIAGYSELLLVDPSALGQHERVRRDLTLINTAAQDAAAVVGRLREFYRPREAHRPLRPVNLTDLVAQAISLTQPRWRDQALGRGIAINIATELIETPTIAGDAGELRDVLTNLIFNAIDAMPTGGTITLRTRREGDYVVLEVEDNGLGMSDEVRMHCLEPFFTTKGELGSGLGLGMVYGIVQRHSGSLSITSAPGAGTTVSVSLPLGPTETLAEASLPAAPVGRLRVLVVEDEPAVRQLLTACLAVDGHSVETADNGLDGLAKYRAGQFDLVVTDRAMPEMSGSQLATAIKREAPGAKILMLTGFSPAPDSGTDGQGSVDLVVEKPVKLVVLRQALAQLLAPAEQLV